MVFLTGSGFRGEDLIGNVSDESDGDSGEGLGGNGADEGSIGAAVFSVRLEDSFVVAHVRNYTSEGGILSRGKPCIRLSLMQGTGGCSG